jgi:YrbI family 3-deoxy-D-manno-octulosonate 8-phosphate phosphatase
MTTVALIPARGGSKGIPRKNLVAIGGRPLVVHSIAQAKACAGIDRVFVSTDDDEIATVAEAAGAEIVRRPASLAGDTASTESAITHALDVWRDGGLVPDRVVLLQATSPFRAPGQLDEALAQFDRTGCESMLSVVRFVGFVWRTAKDGLAAPINYEPTRRPRRQEIEDMTLETGSFYVFTREMYERTGSRLGGRISAFEVPHEDAIDIDEPADLDRARAEAKRRGIDVGPDLATIDWLWLDVDGTLTDGAMYYGEGGDELKRFDTRDGAGIAAFRALGGRVAIVTGEMSRAAGRRAEKLAVDHVVLGCRDKGTAFEDFCRRFQTSGERVVAVGDDCNDLPLTGRVAMFVAPADARPEVRAAADFVTTAPGGHGAVRELTDKLVAARKRLRRVA